MTIQSHEMNLTKTTNQNQTSRRSRIKKSLKTTLYWIRLLVYSNTPLKPSTEDLETIVNFFEYNDTLASSGQPLKSQFKTIQKAGYTAVINLATTDFVECPVKDETAVVKGLGMKYFHIPVDFFRPDMNDFKSFARLMNELPNEKIWVHCSANARASAFIYKYRTLILGEDSGIALWDLREIWEPFGPWKTFVYEDLFAKGFDVQEQGRFQP